MKTSPVTLKELNQKIRALIKNHIESYWLTAEISELTINYSGHCYIEFVQKNETTDKIEAKARAIIWSNVFRMIQPYFETTTGQTFTEGIKIMVRVVPEFHEIYGYSLNIVDIEPTYTVGEIAIRKQKIIEKLASEGVLEMNRELELPYLTRRIAVISSKTAAGYEDFIDQLQLNSQGFKFYTKLFPAVVQGNEAEASIIDQLDKIFGYVELFDAVVIIRGGGSQSDLDCFNNYWLAYNVAQFPLPVITGIGHEQDDSVVDRVANTRLKTPTAVAEFLIDQLALVEKDLLETQLELIEQVQGQIVEENTNLKESAYKLRDSLQSRILAENKRLSLISGAYISKVKTNLKTCSESLVKKRFLLEEKCRTLFKNANNTLNKDLLVLKHSVSQSLAKHKNSIERSKEGIMLRDPALILKKGFSITQYKGKSITNSTPLSPGDEIETILYNGKVKSTINEKQNG